MPSKSVILKDRAKRVAKAHACEHCGGYSYKKLAVREPTATQRKELQEAWHAVKSCGVCGLEQEMGIDAEGDVLYVN